ncbi:MAG: 16S rRNA (cytosine(1402)-N(4))-methyltransferase RsmH [Clostridia bacterium]|nr:16S rRNA (cytosine(1402)-N(4))-methyltransferase RsmH [Clostridia bacterium]
MAAAGSAQAERRGTEEPEVTESSYHTPIMLSQVLELLSPERCMATVDGTLGGGGHSEGILERLPAGAHHFGIDRDLDAINAASERLSKYEGFHPIHGNFFDMKDILPLEEYGIQAVDGILLDLGVSSHQLDDGSRGFSYGQEAPLDMRMDRTAPLSARDVVNGYDARKLFEIIRDYGEERFAYRIANAIAEAREKAPIETTTELAEIIKAAIPAPARREGPHPARRTFQALRIEVNSELAGLAEAVKNAAMLLSPGGVMCVITFHSLEDRIVKNVFRELKDPCTCPPSAPICICGKKPIAEILTPKPITADEDELLSNPRARSAKLRAIRRIHI